VFADGRIAVSWLITPVRSRPLPAGGSLNMVHLGVGLIFSVVHFRPAGNPSVLADDKGS
jgi:hypothetical protein